MGEISKSDRLTFLLALNPKTGYVCATEKANLKECIPLYSGTFKECKKHADIMNRQFEKV